MADYSFEQVVDFASENGFECLEVACWPKGKAERLHHLRRATCMRRLIF